MDLRAIAMKEYSTFHKSLLPPGGLTSYPGHLCVEGSNPLQKCSQCILQFQLTGLDGLVLYLEHSLGRGVLPPL